MKKNLDNVFAKNLIALRKQEGITRSELARRLGVNINTFTNYELGGREPKYDLLVKIADFFNVTVDALLRDKSGNIKKMSNGTILLSFQVPANNKEIFRTYAKNTLDSAIEQFLKPEMFTPDDIPVQMTIMIGAVSMR